VSLGLCSARSAPHSDVCCERCSICLRVPGHRVMRAAHTTDTEHMAAAACRTALACMHLLSTQGLGAQPIALVAAVYCARICSWNLLQRRVGTRVFSRCGTAGCLAQW
jgi:hypothetical protein